MYVCATCLYMQNIFAFFSNKMSPCMVQPHHARGQITLQDVLITKQQ